MLRVGEVFFVKFKETCANQVGVINERLKIGTNCYNLVLEVGGGGSSETCSTR